MGGQACILYGAAEFSRDTDLVVLAERDNLSRLASALEELQAVRIAVPPFNEEYLHRGLAVHFRCSDPEAAGQRIDVMSKLRGVDSFTELWKRRLTITDPDGNSCDLLSLPDLVRAKKTQRDKDWPMIRQLLESHYFKNRAAATNPQIEFWLMEMRTPGILLTLARSYPAATHRLQVVRPLLSFSISQDVTSLSRALIQEEHEERKIDQAYWQPLKKELEGLRRFK